MRVNTTSSFNVNYKVAVTCIILHWQFHKMFCWIRVTACVQSVHDQHAHMISGGHVCIDDDVVKVKTSLHQAFSQVVDVMNLSFVHALLYNTPYK